MHMQLKEVLQSQKYDIEKEYSKQLIEREQLKQTTPLLQNSLIKVITGPRRAGKSIFSLELLKEKKFAYANFDEEELLKIKDKDLLLQNMIETYGDFKFMLLDEIQNLKNWELFVNKMQRKGFNLIITGSNSKLLATELATHLTGRHTPIQILPFSFKEFLKTKKIEENPEIPETKGKTLNLLENYLQNGGYPETATTNINPKNYLKNLFDSLILNDVVKRHKIRNPTAVYNLARYLISNFANQTTMTKTKNTLNIGSVHTTEKYSHYIEEAYLTFFIERHSTKTKEKIKAPKKTYVIDNGFINALNVQTFQDKVRLMKNLVAIELLKRSRLQDFQINYWKGSQQKEVDFITTRNNQTLQLVQVTNATTKQEVNQREAKAMLEASEKLKCDNLLIITWDYENVEEEQGKKIIFTPLWKWLLKN
jgi:predicted AAA+ superfamily ATPase